MQINAAPEETERARHHDTKQREERRRMAFLERKIQRLTETLARSTRAETMAKLQKKINRATREKEKLRLYLL